MDWRSVTFDWNRARAFLVTAEEGSLSAAAQALGMTQPTVGRQVAALEEELDVLLFDRAGKQLILTPSGLELIDHVRHMSEAASRLSLVASGQSQQLSGEVCISAIELISVHLLPPVVQLIREKYPNISIELVSTDQFSDLGRREADIAIRNARPTHPDLVAKKIGDSNARLYATQAYLDRLSRPITKELLKDANFTSFNRHDGSVASLSPLGLDLTADNFPVVSESMLVQWELTKLGLAAGLMMESIGDKEPSVRRVLEDSDVISFPLWLVAHKELKSSKRIRVVFDLLAESLAQPGSEMSD